MRPPAHTEGEANTSPARAEWAARTTDAKTLDLLGRDANAFLHQALSSPCASTITKAEGIWIEDTAGRRFMDFHGNSVHHIGYGHPRLIAAIKDQLDTLPFSPRRFTNDVSVALAERLGDIAPGDLNKVLFTTGGSDANEVALRLARAATGRFKTLSFWDSFHGAGFGAASVGGEATFRSHIAGPLLPGAEHVAPFNCYRCAYGHSGPDTCGLPCAGMVDYVLAKEGDIAAVIAEPMRAVPIVPPPGYWKSVRAACHHHGALLIFDEIPTGLGKMPIAAVIARHDLDVAGDFAIGHYTHEKNPVTARAALTTLDIIADENLYERAAELGTYAIDRLSDLIGHHPNVGKISGRGLMIGVDLVMDRDNREPATELAEKVYYRCLENGLSFKISAGSVLTLSPPLTISRSDLERALSIVAQALADMS